MLSMLIDHSFILNPVPLVINLQRSKNTSPAVHLLENPENTLLDLIGQELCDKRSLERILVPKPSVLLGKNELDCHCVPHSILSGRSEGLVPTVCVQAIRVISQCIKGLQCSPIVIPSELL